jgi:hypothetical protein
MQCFELYIGDTTFPSVKAYQNKEATHLALHPNISKSSGSVCLGDLAQGGNSSPTLKSFITMMRMVNFDSAYWGRTTFDSIFTNPTPKSGLLHIHDWKDIEGLIPINMQKGIL